MFNSYFILCNLVSKYIYIAFISTFLFLLINCYLLTRFLSSANELITGDEWDVIHS